MKYTSLFLAARVSLFTPPQRYIFTVNIYIKSGHKYVRTMDKECGTFGDVGCLVLWDVRLWDILLWDVSCCGMFGDWGV